MFEQKCVISVTDHERGVMVRVLNDARNGALRGGKPTEDLDNLLIKAIDAPTKREKRRADRAAR